MEMTYDTLLRPTWSPVRQCDDTIYSIFGLCSSSSTGFAPNILGFDLNVHILQIIYYIVCTLATRLAKEAD